MPPRVRGREDLHLPRSAKRAGLPNRSLILVLNRTLRDTVSSDGMREIYEIVVAVSRP
jgi:hypothetical protein